MYPNTAPVRGGGVPLEPILKNGTVPRSYSRGRGTLERSYSNSKSTYDFPSSTSLNQTTTAYGRSLTRMSSYGSSSGASSRLKTNQNGGFRSTDVDSRNAYNANGYSATPNNNFRRTGGGNSFQSTSVDSEYPKAVLPRRSTSMQIVATRHRPLCQCGFFYVLKRYLGCAPPQTSDGHQPICVLFSVFLLVSLLLVSGVMLFLRGGERYLT